MNLILLHLLPQRAPRRVHHLSKRAKVRLLLHWDLLREPSVKTRIKSKTH
jgi:hypothetical protein